jgi:hypothetical protein
VRLHGHAQSQRHGPVAEVAALTLQGGACGIALVP